VRHRHLDEEFAVKICDLPDNLRDFESHLRTWARLGDQRHPNLVGFHEAFHDSSFGYLVMELCYCTLLDAFRAEKTLDEHVLAPYFMDMLRGLQHLHNFNIVHRDVKQDNFLISCADAKTVQLCDFGLAEVLPVDKRGAVGEISGVCGTAPYLSPEMLAIKGKYGTSTDIWSYAVIVYTMFFGCFPYGETMPQGITAATKKTLMKKAIQTDESPPTFETATKLNYNGHVSEVAVAFVKALLVRDSHKRPSASAAMQLDYLKHASEYAYAAETQSAWSPPPTLVPMLKGATRSGAFTTKAPKTNPGLDVPLLELKNKSAGRILFDSPKADLFSESTSTCSTSYSKRSKSKASSESTMSSVSSRKTSSL
jgi:serine/threonine protein kinase